VVTRPINRFPRKILSTILNERDVFILTEADKLRGSVADAQEIYGYYGNGVRGKLGTECLVIVGPPGWCDVDQPRVYGSVYASCNQIGTAVCRDNDFWSGCRA